MHYFVEITCLEYEDVSSGFVMSKVMDVLHLCLVNLDKKLGTNPVGISFPEYRYGEDEKKPRIGSKIRLFSRDSSHLESLQLKQQLLRLSDYVHIRSISSIDRPNLTYASYKRVQPKSSRERLIRRQARRSGLPEEEVRQQYQGFGEQQIKLPYVNMKSHSSDRRFRLFIRKQAAEATPAKEWEFSTYGLSNSVPVPDF